MKRYVMSGACAVLLAGAIASAQSTTSGQQQPPAPTQPQAMQSEMTTTIEGCVYREQDVPGRAPNVAERAGVLEDYILVAAKSDPAGGAVGTSGTDPSAAGAMAKPKMFKLEHADDSKLSALVGKRVTVTGKVSAEHGDRAATGAAQATELPRFDVTTIAEATGECPAKPADPKK